MLNAQYIADFVADFARSTDSDVPSGLDYEALLNEVEARSAYAFKAHRISDNLSGWERDDVYLSAVSDSLESVIRQVFIDAYC